MAEEVDSEILITRRIDADFSELGGANHTVEWQLRVRELIQFYDKSAKPPTEEQRIQLVHQLALVCSNNFDSHRQPYLQALPPHYDYIIFT